MPLSPEVHLVPAEKVSIGQRVALMNAAYVDYYVPIRINAEQMALMDRFYDVDSERSVVARTRWDSIGMALLALHADRAWVSGVGVVPSWRRMGVGGLMMRTLISGARDAGVRELLLEVIDRNVGAQRLYETLGFQAVRELLTWQRPASAGALPIPPERLVTARVEDLLKWYTPWHSSAACWQRDLASITNMADRLTGYRLDFKGEPAAYLLGLVGDENVAIVDIGVNAGSDLLMPGRALLQAVVTLHYGRSFSIINVGEDDSVSRVLAALGFLVTLRQLEMSMRLDEAHPEDDA